MIQNGRAAKLGKTRLVAVERGSERMVEIRPDGSRVPTDRFAEPEILKLFAKGRAVDGRRPSCRGRAQSQAVRAAQCLAMALAAREFRTDRRMAGTGAGDGGRLPGQSGAGSLSRPAVAIGGIWTDWTEEGTLLKIFDPFPVRRGRIYATQPDRFFASGRPFPGGDFLCAGGRGHQDLGSYQIWKTTSRNTGGAKNGTASPARTGTPAPQTGALTN